MCGRFAQHYTFSEIAETIDILAPPSNAEPRYNIGRFQKAWFIRRDEDETVLERALFEFVPFFHDKPLKEKKYTSFNAKSEGLMDGSTRSFKPAYGRSQFGVLPVSGFYEWPRPKAKGAAPMYITAREDDVLYLGCIWSEWADPENGEILMTFAIITTPANAFMGQIPHHRCPVVVSKDRLDDWLSIDSEQTSEFFAPAPEDAFAGRWVSNYVNKIGNEGEGCIGFM